MIIRNLSLSVVSKVKVYLKVVFYSTNVIMSAEQLEKTNVEEIWLKLLTSS